MASVFSLPEAEQVEKRTKVQVSYDIWSQSTELGPKAKMPVAGPNSLATKTAMPFRSALKVSWLHIESYASEDILREGEVNQGGREPVVLNQN